MRALVGPFVRAVLGTASLALLSAGCDAGSRAAPAAVPEQLRDHVLPAVPTDVQERLSIGFEGKLQLVGLTLTPRDRVRAGQQLRLELCWQRLEPFVASEGTADWAPVTRLLDGSGRPLDPIAPVVSRLTAGEAAFLPRYWPLGAVVVDEQEITVPAEIDAKEIVIAVAVERTWGYERPLRERSASGVAVARDGRVEGQLVRPGVEDATMKMRLRVLGGPSAEGQAILARLAVEGARPRRPAPSRRPGPRPE